MLSSCLLRPVAGGIMREINEGVRCKPPEYQEVTGKKVKYISNLGYSRFPTLTTTCLHNSDAWPIGMFRLKETVHDLLDSRAQTWKSITIWEGLIMQSFAIMSTQVLETDVSYMSPMEFWDVFGLPALNTLFGLGCPTLLIFRCTQVGQQLLCTGRGDSHGNCGSTYCVRTRPCRFHPSPWAPTEIMVAWNRHRCGHGPTVTNKGNYTIFDHHPMDRTQHNSEARFVVVADQAANSIAHAFWISGICHHVSSEHRN